MIRRSGPTPPSRRRESGTAIDPLLVLSLELVESGRQLRTAQIGEHLPLLLYDFDDLSWRKFQFSSALQISQQGTHAEGFVRR